MQEGSQAELTLESEGKTLITVNLPPVGVSELFEPL